MVSQGQLQEAVAVLGLADLLIMGSNPGLAIFFLLWVLACPNFGECTARVKLELTDFRVE